MVGRKEEEAHFAAMAVKAEQAFKDVFLNQYGYLFDYVDEKDQEQDWSVRPNMIFAVALDYSPLSLPEKKTVLIFVQRSY